MAERLSRKREVSVLVVPLTGPSQASIPCSRRWREEDYQCIVTLQMPQKETTLPVLIHFQQEEDELRSLTLKLSVRRVPRGEIGASQTGEM